MPMAGAAENWLSHPTTERDQSAARARLASGLRRLPASLTVRLEGDLVADTTVGHGVFEVSIGGAQFSITRAARLEIECQPAFRTEGDNRELAFVLMEIRAEHR
jgi:hypothetical protein